MGRTHAELLASISAYELQQWRAFRRIYGPIGRRRDDYLAALICSTIASAFAAKGKAPSVSDFVPEWDKREVGDGDDP